MASGDITRATRVQLANLTRLDNKADNLAHAFGEIDLGASAGPAAINVYLELPITSSGADTYDIYLLESSDGTDWTDDIDPTDDTGDVKAKLYEAKLLKPVSAVYVTTNHEIARLHFAIDCFRVPRFIGFVRDNQSGQTTPTSPTADGYYETLKVS